MRSRVLILGMVTSMLLSWGQSATADMLTLPFTYEFSKATSPSGELPWATATFDDRDTVGSVTLQLELGNLVEDEFVGLALFNLDPALDPASLVFGSPMKIGDFTDPAIGVGVNAFRGAGDQLFDLQFDFAQSNSKNYEGRFSAGESMLLEITGPGLVAGSFDFPSGSDNGLGPVTAAIHVQSIGPEGDSGWVTDTDSASRIGVPEPTTLLNLLSIAGLGMIALACRRYGRG